MNASIRTATSVDARAIVAVAGDVWPDEALDAVMIEQLVAESERATFVAELNGRVVGFVDGFATRGANGLLRWEVDLLAVSSAAQGLGIGRQLVGASVAAGAEARAVSARGLIRVWNVASERVFAACGFLPDRETSELWLSSGILPERSQSSLHIVPVQTFRYVGIWLENVTAEALNSLRSSEDAAVIGAVIRVTEREATAAAEAVGLQAAGPYRFWEQTFGASAG